MKAPVFTAREVLQFAVKNEREGETFYRKIAARITDPVMSKLLLMLAKEETLHERVFLHMLAQVDRCETFRTDPGEYVAYLLEYFTSDVLFATNRAEDLPLSPDPGDALDFGIRREIDSVIYYMHAKEVMSDSQAAVVDKIIEEERGHFLKLTEMKRRFAAKKGMAPKGGKRIGTRSAFDRAMRKPEIISNGKVQVPRLPD